MSLYSRVIFPRLCDLALDRPHVAEQRRVLLESVRGEVLEIGLGTGLNLPHYPQHVRSITAIDPNRGMLAKAQRRIERAEIEVDLRNASGESLPFDDASFDCVVCAFTLCSIAMPDSALREMHRVIRPGGRLLFLEHGLSPEPQVQKWQRRLNRIERWLADNCHLDRNVRELIERQPFSDVQTDEFYLEKTPRTHGYLYRGAATK